ncbi:MAG TPA: 5-(carboxyamino)imidazole ribonucleotide mutase [Candidatus Thermoplasmatota archaeon]|nr:5-(carboxyamino)imidazole ribonucleotide mutase [Candidatus Thermoplasmatota archaeon]
MAPDVMVLLGSKTDYPVAEKCLKVLADLGIGHECHVASAHRTPAYVEELVRKRGAKVFVGMAGMAAHLPGVIAAMTTRPVIGVPCSGGVGLDSLLSIVQMPPGVPVATVGMDRGDNAGWLAAEMLALSDAALGKRIEAARRKAAEKVMADDASLPKGGA